MDISMFGLESLLRCKTNPRVCRTGGLLDAATLCLNSTLASQAVQGTDEGLILKIKEEG